MRFASLGSGSSGNSLVVQHGSTAILLDCGFGLRDTVFRLARLGLAPEDISAVILTHEHQDHAGSAYAFAVRHDLTVILTHGTHTALGQFPEKIKLRIIDSHTVFHCGDLEIQPFPVPHDAREPVQFVFGDGSHKLGILTDTGSSTPHIEAMLSGCDALVLECNHDVDMLAAGNYPRPLKQRILGRMGHLDNHCAAEILASLDNSRLQHLIAAHLSERNNLPELARSALAKALNCGEEWIGIASQEEGFGWREII